MNRVAMRLIVSMWLVLGSSLFVAAQQPATGLPSLGSFSGGPFDTVDLANLNVHFSIPVFGRPGRGIPFSYNLSYDSLVWMPVTSGPTTSWRPVSSNWGWRAITEAATGYVTAAGPDSEQTCSYLSGTATLYGATETTYGDLVYHDPVGGIHSIELL
jgi:hypothetical protein